MPPLALIAGIPLGVYRRARGKPDCPAWRIQVIPSQDQRKADLGRIWKRVMDQTDASNADGIHLFLSHYRENEYPRFEEEVSCSYRILWIPRAVSNYYGTNAFVDWIKTALEFEEGWRTSIRPTVDSPLLLPETGFSAQESVMDMWHRVRSVRQDKDTLGAVQKTISRFKIRHGRDNGWLDFRRLYFSKGVPHGGYHLPKWRRRKFTFELPDGFHFDVRHSEGSSFRIQDQVGRRLEFKEYTNIDPHGHLRNGR